MKPLIQLLNETISLNSKEYDFIKKQIDRRANTDECNMEAHSFNAMMGFLFVWSETPQGHAYWHDIILKENEMKENLLNH